jgi:hypothetical protein
MGNMKTSLNIDDFVFKTARKEALKNKSTVGEVISLWARMGLESLKKNAKAKVPVFKPADLGGVARLDLHNRRDWLDALDK